MTQPDRDGGEKPKHEDVVKEITPSGAVVIMTRKEATRWRKLIKSKINDSKVEIANEEQ